MVLSLLVLSLSKQQYRMSEGPVTQQFAHKITQGMP
jgi:hypothetical protein